MKLSHLLELDGSWKEKICVDGRDADRESARQIHRHSFISLPYFLLHSALLHSPQAKRNKNASRALVRFSSLPFPPGSLCCFSYTLVWTLSDESAAGV